MTTIRFAPGIAAAIRNAAARDGMTVSAWVRHLVDREIAARTGTCPTCGHPAVHATPEVAAGLEQP